MWPFTRRIKRPANPCLHIEYMPDNSLNVVCTWPKTNETNRVPVATSLAALLLSMCSHETLELIFQSAQTGGETQKDQKTAQLVEILIEEYLVAEEPDEDKPVINALGCFQPDEEDEIENNM